MLAKLNAVSTGLTTAISKLITFISLENDRDVDALFKLAVKECIP